MILYEGTGTVTLRNVEDALRHVGQQGEFARSRIEEVYGVAFENGAQTAVVEEAD
jgi:hypothetical protein